MQRNFKKFAKFAVLCGLAVGIMVHPAFATDAPVRTTEKVVVTAGRIAEKAKTVTNNVTVLDEEYIQKNQHKSLDQILVQQGVQIVSTAPDTGAPAQVMLRGMRSTYDDPNSGHVLILINGQRTSLTSLNMIPMVCIERVEVLRGPAAVQYGSQAFGGVVNIITKRGTDQTQASVEIGGGSWESWKGTAGVAGMVGDVDYAFGFSHSMRDKGWKDGKGNRMTNSEVGGMTRWYGNVGYNFLDEHRISLTVMGANDDRLESPGPVYDMFNQYVPNGSNLTDYFDRRNFAVLANYEGGMKEYGLSWKVNYGHSEEVYNAYDWNPIEKEYITDGMQAQMTWRRDFFSLTGGFDWNKMEVETTGNSIIPKYELTNMSTFLIAKTMFFDDRLVFSVGARYDDYDFKMGEDRSEDNLSLNAGVAATPWDWITFRANIGEAFRMPTGIETAGYKSITSEVIPNPNLEPEEGLGWDVGFDINHKGFKAALTYFSIDYENKIEIDYPEAYKNNYNLSHYKNRAGTTKLRGIEGNISYDLGQAFGWDFMLRPYVNFTHMMDYEANEPDSANNITDIAKVRDWIVGYGINYSHPSIGLDIDLSCTYLGEQYESYTYGNPNLYGGKNTIVDMTILKTLYETEDMGKVSAKLDLRNIFDEEYHYSYGYPMPGRSFFLSLIWNY